MDPGRVDPLERRPGEEIPGAPTRGRQSLSALLPNGHTVWLRVDTPFATSARLERLALLARRLHGRRALHLHAQGFALGHVADTFEGRALRLSRTQVRRARRLRRRMLAAYRKTDARLSKAAARFQARVEKQLAIDRENVRRLRRRELWDMALLVTMFPLFAAYGQRGRPFGANNLALTLAGLIWLVGEEVVEAIFGSHDPVAPHAIRDADIWSYIAPIGNLLAGWWLLDDFQHERFVTGRTALPPQWVQADVVGANIEYRFSGRIDLSPQIASALIADFEVFAGVPAVASLATVTPTADGLASATHVTSLTARVDGRYLLLEVQAAGQDLRPLPTDPIPQVLEALDVAWMVDTQKPEAP
jgi:hypothetical protein